MNRRQQNLMNMYQAVIAYFDENTLAWSTKLAVATAFANVRNCYDRLAAISLQQQQGITKGYTKQKNQQKAALINLAYNMGLKLLGYAKTNKNAVLLQTVDYSVSDLDGKREQDLVNICQTIYDEGVKFKDIAVDYDITAAELTALQTAMNVFKPMGIERDGVGDKRTIATGDAKSLHKEMVGLMDILDTVTGSLITDKAFVAGHFQARKITDLAGGGNDDENPAEPGA